MEKIHVVKHIKHLPEIEGNVFGCIKDYVRQAFDIGDQNEEYQELLDRQLQMIGEMFISQLSEKYIMNSTVISEWLNDSNLDLVVHLFFDRGVKIGYRLLLRYPDYNLQEGQLIENELPNDLFIELLQNISFHCGFLTYPFLKELENNLRDTLNKLGFFYKNNAKA